jgi:hypothetical protein
MANTRRSRYIVKSYNVTRISRPNAPTLRTTNAERPLFCRSFKLILSMLGASTDEKNCFKTPCSTGAMSPCGHRFTCRNEKLRFYMRNFTNKKIAVALIAFTTGACAQVAFGGPTPRGTAPDNTGTGSGTATGGTQIATPGTTTGTTVGNNGPGANTTGVTNSIIPNPNVAIPQSTSSNGAAVAHPQIDTSRTGTTGTYPGTSNNWQSQRYPVYRGTGTSSIQNYSPTPKQPPQIVGTVSGEGGMMYYVSDDGYMYSRDHDGKFKRFGHFQRHDANDSLYGTTVTPETVIPYSVATPTDGSTVVVPTAPPVTSAPVTTAPQAPDAVAPAGVPDNDSDDVRRRRLEEEDRQRRLTTEDYDRQIRQHERERRESEQDDRTRFYITGKILGDDGKLLYIGSNGYVYYRADDGHLHMVGGGIPE